MIRKFVGIAAAFLLGSTAQTVVAEEFESLAHGTVQVVLTTIGELVVCDPPEVIVRTKVAYKFFKGVCDDRSNFPCGGRLTALVERCGADFIAYTAGGLTSRYLGRRPLRICFDEAGSCTAVDEIGTGLVRRTQTVAFPGEATAQGNSAILVRRSSRFDINGRSVRIPRAEVTADFTLEQAVGPFGAPENCLLAGCGIVSAVTTTPEP